jgi:ribosomal-protein-alanine N-acetyltransferase
MLNTSMKYFPTKFPILKTKDLLLRELTIADADQSVLGLNDIEIAQYLGFTPFPYQKADYLSFLERSQNDFKDKLGLHFAIAELAKPDIMIGCIGLDLNKFSENGSFGYWLLKAYWNKGYMTQALKEVLNYGFSVLHLHKVSASFFEHNIGSARVMQKSGMAYEATMKDEIKRLGKYYNLVYYQTFNPNPAEEK